MGVVWIPMLLKEDLGRELQPGLFPCVDRLLGPSVGAVRAVTDLYKNHGGLLLQHEINFTSSCSIIAVEQLQPSFSQLIQGKIL